MPIRCVTLILDARVSLATIAATAAATVESIIAPPLLPSRSCGDPEHQAIVTGVVPPTINYNDPDPECDLAYTPNEAATLGDITHAASGNLGFGGHNACLSFKKLS